MAENLVWRYADTDVDERSWIWMLVQFDQTPDSDTSRRNNSSAVLSAFYFLLRIRCHVQTSARSPMKDECDCQDCGNDQPQ